MFNSTDKTIPFRLSEAELENLRILRMRTQTSPPIQEDAEKEDVLLEVDARRSDTLRADPKVNSSDAS
jgi:hypothetical protein